MEKKDVNVSATNDVKSAEINVKFSETLAYSAGGLANNFVWTGVLSFLTLFWTDYLLIPAAVCGTFMLICRLWDAINDPIVGMLADKTRSRMGQYRVWILSAALPMLVLFVLVFTKIDSFSQTGQMVFSFIVYFVLVLCNTAVMIPHYSLPSTMTTSARSRGKVVSTRMVGEHIGAISTSFLFFPLVIALGKGDMCKGFSLAAIVIAAISIPFYIWCILGTKERVVQPVPPKVGIKTMFKSLKGNNPFWTLFIGFFCWGAASGLLSGMKAYFFKYNLGNEAEFANNMAIWFAGQAIASLALRYLYKNLKNKRTLPMIGFFVATAISLFLGLYPFTGNDITLYHIITFISGLFMGSGLTGMFSMVPDTTEYTQAKYSLRAAGFLASFTNFANKFGIAVFTAVCGWIMTGAGYVANAEIQNAAISGLFRYGVHFGTALFMLIAAIAMLCYKLDTATFEKLLGDIASKEANKADAVKAE